ncbi:MAG: GspE/PulE family protein [Fusobacteriota bacterium]
MAKKRLGDSLVDSEIITEEQLQTALKKQKDSGDKLGDALIKLGYCTQKQIIQVLGDQMGIPFVNLDTTVIDEAVLDLIDKNIAKRYKIMPIYEYQNKLSLAMVDPLDIFVIDEIEFITNKEVVPSIALESDIMSSIEEHYENEVNTEQLKKYSSDKRSDSDKNEEFQTGTKIDLTKKGKSPAMELVNLIFKQAIEEKASDIHIEEEETELRVRFRIDGILYEVMKPPKKLEASLISRLKIMSNLDIAEKRIPQDGRIELKYKEKEIDIRMSTLPTIYGEKIVMRLLDKSTVETNLDQLGYEGEILKTIRKIIKKPYGIILVTGPTGSGKTSTLYGALSEINTLDKNIITLENPVEYQLKIINQVQVNPDVNLTFASGLRSILRQDPDVVMVGEIRDQETAEIAIEAAMTGHLVFSTLHTNTASGAVARLIDMGVEPFLISSSLIGVVGQRLVRKICDNCKEEVKLDKATIDDLELDFNVGDKVYKGTGCKKCKQTGYKGRTNIYELFIPDEEIKNLIKEKATASELEKKAKDNGMELMRDIGFKKVKLGITTLEEIARVTQN